MFGSTFFLTAAVAAAAAAARVIVSRAVKILYNVDFQLVRAIKLCMANWPRMRRKLQLKLEPEPKLKLKLKLKLKPNPKLLHVARLIEIFFLNFPFFLFCFAD